MKNSIRQIFFAIRYLFDCSHTLVILSLIASFLAAVPAVLSKILIKLTLDALEVGDVSILRTLGYAFGYILVYELFGAFAKHLFLPLLRQKVYYRMLGQLLQKATEIDISCFDDAKVYQNIAWAKTAITSGFFSALDTFELFITNISKLTLTFILFVSVDIVYLLFAIIAFFLIYYFNMVSSSISLEKVRATMEYDRRASYCHKVFSSTEFAKEIRLFSIGRVIAENFRRICIEKREIVKKYLRKIALLDILQVTIPGYFVSEFCLAIFLGYRIIVRHSGNIGDFTMIYSGINSILAALFSLIGPVMQGVFDNTESIEQFRAFMTLDTHIKEGNDDVTGSEHTLAVKNVCFSYSNSNHQILKNICMNVEPHTKIAIVGENGSGKSTLVKLLMRFYDVSEGDIELDKKSIRDYKINAYRGIFSCIFQDYQVYALSVAENIAMSVDWNPQNIESAITLAEFEDSKTTARITAQSQVSKFFDKDGLILSGGQKQKMVLARLFYCSSDILIMDEPSAALDPISEYMFNKRIAEIFSKKTIIWITHRLSATKDADLILFLKDGEIVESGTHEELLHMNGEYATMWTLQAERFVSESY